MESTATEETAARRRTGVDLSRYIQVHGPLDVETTIDVLERTAEKLDAAHVFGVVHGRLGPHALLVDPEAGTVGVREPVGLPEPDPGFVAPEVVAGQEPGAAADVYAIGALVFLCLTGSPPRAGELGVAPLPTGSGAVIVRAMRTDPDDRHPGCGDVVEHLRRSCTDSAAADPASTAAAPLVSGPRRPSTDLRRPTGGGRPRLRQRWPAGLDRLVARKRSVAAVGVLLVAALVGTLLVTLTTSRGPAPAAVARAELVAAIGLGGCRDTPDAPVGSDGLVAAVDCAPGGSGAAGVSYRRYADAASLENAYRARVAAVAPVGAEPCGTAPARAQGPYDLHGTVLGNVLCDDSTGTPSQTWTVEALRLLGTATGPDALELNAWRVEHILERSWMGDIVATINAAAAPAFPTAAESSLLAEVPAASRAFCTRPDAQFVQGNVGDPAGVTAVACGPVDGADTMFWFRFDSAARFATFEGAGPGTAADCRAAPPGFSGSAPYTSVDGRSTGVLGCAQTGDGAVLVWTDERTRRIGVATGDDPVALLQWWQSGT